MTEARAISDGRYVLIKRGLYWKPNSRGYTALLSEAGIYSDEESRGYAGGAHDGMTYRVPASEAEDIAPGANDESKARYWKGRAAAMAEELMAARAKLLAYESAKLPCDVKLPPATTISAGCNLTTLIVGLEVRGMAKITSLSEDTTHAK